MKNQLLKSSEETILNQAQDSTSSLVVPITFTQEVIETEQTSDEIINKGIYNLTVYA